MAETYIILGAGVIGLTTALHLSTTHPTAKIHLLATHLPGDRTISYCSPWAGANWLSVATDNGRQETWDEVTYKKFASLADTDTKNGRRETGVQRMSIKAYFDEEKKNAGILSEGTGRVWYEKLAELRWFGEAELEEKRWDGKGERKPRCGFECGSFLVDVQVYLPWLQSQALKAGIQFRRKTITDIREVFKEYPNVRAVFNCTGLGSYSLKGVEDKNLYPTRGQVMLVETPNPPLRNMYFRSPQRVNKDTTYVFPRNPGGGVILGGCRFDNEWDGDVDLDFAEDIKRRCCALAPELGNPEDLKVIHHAVGLRPSRKGGARIEREYIDGMTVVHNYGAGGAGYQASWGMAKEAVDLLQKSSKL